MIITGLTKDDVDMLLEALEAYKKKDLANNVVNDIIDGLLAVPANAGPAEKARARNNWQAEKANRKALRQETERSFIRLVDILKAKVLLNSKPDHNEEIA